MRGQSAYIEDPGHICCPMQATEFSPGSGARLKLLSKGISGTCLLMALLIRFWNCLHWYVKLKLKVE